MCIRDRHLRGLGGVLTTNYWRAQLGWASDRTLAHQRVLDTAARLEKLYPDETLTAFSRGSAADIERRWDLRLSIYDRLCERDPANSTAHFGRACGSVSYTHLRAHETGRNLVCRL